MYNIQNKLEQVIENLYHKTNINYDDDYKTFIKHESLKSKDYISKHTYKENQTDILSNLILLESHYKELKAFDNIKNDKIKSPKQLSQSMNTYPMKVPNDKNIKVKNGIFITMSIFIIFLISLIFFS